MIRKFLHKLALQQKPQWLLPMIFAAITRLISSIQGEIPDLFPDDEMENIIGSMRPEVRGSGLMDTRENCWKFFIDRVRRQLKVKQSN